MNSVTGWIFKPCLIGYVVRIRSNFFDPKNVLKINLNIYFLFKTILWFPKFRFQTTKNMRYINFQASCCTSKWSYWTEFNDAHVAYWNMPLVLVILLNFAKSIENRLAFWRRFETDNEIFCQSRLEIQIPYEFFLQHSPV